MAQKRVAVVAGPPGPPGSNSSQAAARALSDKDKDGEEPQGKRLRTAGPQCGPALPPPKPEIMSHGIESNSSDSSDKSGPEPQPPADTEDKE